MPFYDTVKAPGPRSHPSPKSASLPGIKLIVQLATTATRHMVEILVTLKAPTLDRLPRANGRAPGRAIAPPPTTATSVPPTVRPAIGPPVVRSSTVAPSPLHSAAPDRTVATSVVRRRTPAASGLHRMAGHKEWWEGTWRNWESWHRCHHPVHTEVLEVEATWCPRGTLATRLREVAIRVCVGARRRDVGRIQDIRVDELELYHRLEVVLPGTAKQKTQQRDLPPASDRQASRRDASQHASSRSAPP